MFTGSNIPRCSRDSLDEQWAKQTRAEMILAGLSQRVALILGTFHLP